MKKIDTIVVAPHFYTMEGAGVGYHSDAAMAVDGGKILKVGNRPEILAEYTAEKMITLGKKGDLAAYRQALSFITREDVAHKLFKEIAPEYAERNGGCTRIIRTGIRRGDAAETALIELVK